ncbi:hypothetical protein N2152v2_001258 [Parachlorella kessleri]
MTSSGEVPGSITDHLQPASRPSRRTKTGFSDQIQRWRRALRDKDKANLKEECRLLIDCETPELFSDSGFTKAEWTYLHSWKRHLPEPVVFLRVLQCLSPIVLWVSAVSTFCGIYATQLEPHGWPNITDHPSFVTPFTLSSFALSLLLVFRTNSSYGRWWEARTAIGRMFNWPRIIVRLSIAYFPKDQEYLVRAVGRWAAVLAASTFAYIRGDGSYWVHTENMLSPEELQWLKTREQPPFAALLVISGLVKRARLDSWQRAQIEQAISEFDLLVGAAERISRQPIPLAYTRMASRYLIVFVTFLPFAFWSLFGWVTIPIMATLTFLLVGLENIGIQIEEPYTVLPLHRFSVGIKRGVELTLAHWRTAEEVVEWAARPPPGPPASEGGEWAAGGVPLPPRRNGMHREGVVGVTVEEGP